MKSIISISIDDCHYFFNLSGTTDEIVFDISHRIKQMILKKLSLKNSIIGTKKMAINTVKIMFKPDAATNLTEWILNKTNLSLSFCESSLCYISSMLNAYTNSPPNIRTDVTSFDALKWGIFSLVSSFKEGLRDVFDESYQRGNPFYAWAVPL